MHAPSLSRLFVVCVCFMFTFVNTHVCNAQLSSLHVRVAGSAGHSPATRSSAPESMRQDHDVAALGVGGGGGGVVKPKERLRSLIGGLTR